MGALFLAVVLAPGDLPAQTNAPKAAPSNRCLLIVETSRAMQRRSDATLKVVQDLVSSGLNGQLRAGDTLGLWTFNETLQAGRFPLQTWSSEARWDIAARVQAFLKAQKFEKQPAFDKVLPALTYIVEHSGRLTVILVSTGEGKVQGTPFDEPIAQFYQQWRDQQQKSRMPFVTVLRAQNGRLVDFALNTPPWPLQIPGPPQDTRAAEAVQSKLQQALQQAQGTSAPPLIVTGRKPQPAETVAPQPQPATATNQAPAVAAALPVTNKPAVPPPAAPSVPAAQVTETQATPVASALRPTQPPPQAPPPPAPLVAPKVETANTSAEKPAAAALPKPKAPVPEPSVAAAQPHPATNEPPRPAPVVEPKPASASTSLPKAPALPPPPAAPSAQAGTATPAWSLSSPNLLWIAVVAVTVVLAVLILLRLRRSRSVSHGSLITRSYEREKKP